MTPQVVVHPKARNQVPKVPKEPIPDLTISRYSWMKPEVGVYFSNFRTPKSIADIRKVITISGDECFPC